MRIFVFVLSLLLPTAAAAQSTYYVAEGGDDGVAGDSTSPWATLQHAADQVAAGDTVIVRPGSYVGFQLTTSGTMSSPITFRGEAGAIVNRDNSDTPDGINLEGASFIVLDGLEVRDVTRAGIRAVLCEHVTMRNIVADNNGRWGIFTGHCDDLLLEDNSCSRSGVEHGIYVSNSGDRPVVRRNRLFSNNANGLHMNGDESAGGDGIISDALVEENVIWDNGRGGGSGINCDGVQDSVIRNNLIYGNHASGISLYRIDAAQGARDNLVINNTVVQAADGRWAMNIQAGSTGNRLLNNIFLSRHSFRGAIDISPDSVSGLESDYNVVVGRFTNDDGDSVMDLAGWRAMGFGANSIEASIDAVFEAPGSDDYHLLAGSPAEDSGTATDAPPTDYEGHPRPSGAGVDIGADERCPAPCSGGTRDGGPGDPDAGVSPGDDAGVTPGDDAGVIPGTDGGVRPGPDGAVAGTDAGPGGGGDEGCGCRVGAPGGAHGAWLVFVLGLALVRRRGSRAGG